VLSARIKTRVFWVGGSNNILLEAGHRIWLVSSDYAKALESVVPSGSLTGGVVAKSGALLATSRHPAQCHRIAARLNEVGGEFAQAIRDHLPEIIGITAGFLMAEATSPFLAAAPTGVSQAAAAVIQLALAAFGAAGMVEARIEALKLGMIAERQSPRSGAHRRPVLASSGPELDVLAPGGRRAARRAEHG
jgi:hypothetical protein